jgi:hypothetical protein
MIIYPTVIQDKWARVKSVFLICVTLLASTSCALAANAPFAVDISSKHAWQIGDNIEINVQLTNLTDHELRMSTILGRDQAEFDNQVSVVDDSGSSPPKTRFYKLLTQDTDDLQPLPNGAVSPGPSYEETVLTLSAKQSNSDKFVLNKLYELRPGNYTIWIVRKDNVSGKKAVSNKLAITISGPSE